jgi:hypothetical protein
MTPRDGRYRLLEAPLAADGKSRWRLIPAAARPCGGRRSRPVLGLGRHTSSGGEETERSEDRRAPRALVVLHAASWRFAYREALSADYLAAASCA